MGYGYPAIGISEYLKTVNGQMVGGMVAFGSAELGKLAAFVC